MYVPQIKKLPVTFAANDDCSNLKFVELKKLADKRRWQQRFADDYDGGVGPVVDALFEEPVVKCIVAADGDVQKGYMRLTDYGSIVPAVNNGVWCLQDIYVKKAYRNAGVMRRMLKHAADNCSVKLIYITDDRYFNNEAKFKDLGFSDFLYDSDLYLGHAVHESYRQILFDYLQPKAA